LDNATRWRSLRPMTEDLFRTEIERMHRLRASLAELDAAERAAFVRDLIESGAGSADDWVLCARDAQLPPPGDWSIWLLLVVAGLAKRTPYPNACTRRSALVLNA